MLALRHRIVSNRVRADSLDPDGSPSSKSSPRKSGPRRFLLTPRKKDRKSSGENPSVTAVEEVDFYPHVVDADPTEVSDSTSSLDAVRTAIAHEGSDSPPSPSTSSTENLSSSRDGPEHEIVFSDDKEATSVFDYAWTANSADARKEPLDQSIVLNPPDSPQMNAAATAAKVTPEKAPSKSSKSTSKKITRTFLHPSPGKMRKSPEKTSPVKSSSSVSSILSRGKNRERLRVSVESPSGRSSSKSKSQRHRHARVKKIRVHDQLQRHATSVTSPHKPLPIITEDMDRVFMLLLEPSAKIFELIQVYYDPATSTIGDLIRRIPENTTEEALANQPYHGLTRPKRRSKPWLEADETISHAGIRDGNVLVPIPNGYMPKHIVRLGKTILANPRIQGLLDRADPTRRHRRQSDSPRRSSRKGSSSGRSLTSPPMESVVEEPGENTEQSMKRAIKHAQADNERVDRTGGVKELVHPGSIHSRRSLSNLLMSAANNKRRSTDSVSSRSEISGRSETSSLDIEDLLKSTSAPTLTGVYDEDSVAGSYSSWSQSLDSSFVSTASSKSLVSRRLVEIQSTRRQRSRRFQKNIRLCVAASILTMIAWYWYDPNGYKANMVSDSPMGTFGSVQFGLVLFLLTKFQRWSLAQGSVGESKCPFLNASHLALERLRERS